MQYLLPLLVTAVVDQSNWYRAGLSLPTMAFALSTAQFVVFARNRSFGLNAGRFMERCCRS